MNADGLVNLIKEPDFWSSVPKGDMSSLALSRPTDGDSAMVKPVYKLHQKTFDLSSKDDLLEYETLRSDVLSKDKGLLEVYFCRHIDLDRSRVVVDYEWCEVTLVPLLDSKIENKVGAHNATRTGDLIIS